MESGVKFAKLPRSGLVQRPLPGARRAGTLGFEIGAHALRATAATNALDHQADIAKVPEWLGHANIATTRIYDHRRTRPEDSPTFKVAY
jgi:integrase/recombinase XerD